MKIIFDQHPEVTAGMSERQDGSMVWWNTKPVDETVRQNRERYFQDQGVSPSRVVAGGLIHGTRVAVVGDEEAGEYLLDTDALITNNPNLFLTITAADCVPVFFFDPVHESIGIAHAGWKGLVKGVLENVVREMKKSYGSEPRQLLVAVGPHIQPCHFEVGEEVASQFDESNIEQRDGSMFAHLGREAVLRLQKMGVGHVTSDSTCTYCSAECFYSARHDKTKPLQGGAAYIGLVGAV